MWSNIKQACGLDVEKRLVRQRLNEPRASVCYRGGPLLKRLLNKLSQHQFYVHWENCFMNHPLFCFVLKEY